MPLPIYHVAWTSPEGDEGRATCINHREVQALLTELLYTGKRGARIVVELK